MQINTWQNRLFELYFCNTYVYGREYVRVANQPFPTDLISYLIDHHKPLTTSAHAVIKI